MAKANNSRETLWKPLQVKKSEDYGYRKAVQAYKVIKQIPAAQSDALANPTFGSGGGAQYFVSPANQQYLEPMGVTPLGE